MKMFKRIILDVPRGTSFVLLIMLTFFTMFPTVLSANAILYPEITTKASLLMDAESGIIYIENNIDESLPIASLTKLMSIYVFLEDMDAQEKLTMDSQATISQKAAGIKVENPEISGVYYQVGQKMKVSDLLDLALVYSDNSATIALSELASGSESKHVQKMNDKAKELGMDSTHFYNVSGLTMRDYGSYQIPGTNPNDYNVSSARDLGILTYNLLKDYPGIINITSKKSIDYQGYTYYNWNKMLEGTEDVYSFDGVKGLKTGTTEEAGECFIGYYEAGGKKYVSVVLGANKGGRNRWDETIRMYRWIVKQDLMKFLSKDQKVYSYNVKGAIGGKIDLYPVADIDILSADNIYFSLISKDLNKEYFNDDGILIKDIPAGKTVLTYVYEVPEDSVATNSVLTKDNTLEINLVSKKDIKEENAFLKIFSSIKIFIEELYKSM